MQKTTKITFRKLPKILPILPAEDALLLPGGYIRLHCSQPHFINLIEDVLSTRDRLLGLLLSRRESDQFYSMGCAGRISGFDEDEDGTYHVSLLGICRFFIEEDLPNKRGYNRVAPDWKQFAKDFDHAGEISNSAKKHLVSLLRLYLKRVENEADIDWETILAAPSLNIVTFFSMNLPFEGRDRQALLEAKTLVARTKILESLLEIGIVEPQEKPREH